MNKFKSNKTNAIGAVESRSVKIESDWMNTENAAHYLQTTPKHLLNLTSNGYIVYYKFGRLNRYLKSDLDNLILKNKKGGYQWVS